MPVGNFTVSIQVGELAGQQFVDIDALVDTCATYSVLPEEVLEQLGVEREGQRRFELDDDRIVEYPVGYARMRLEEQEIIAMVVFAPEATAPLLGATALETADFTVDPIHRQLISVPALLKCAFGSPVGDVDAFKWESKQLRQASRDLTAKLEVQETV